MNTNRAEERESRRRGLLESSASLCSWRNQGLLAQAVRNFFPTLQHAFILSWLPEQAEDIYWLLVSRTEIAKIELARNQEIQENAASVKIVSVETFRHRRLSRQVREKLEIALELIER
jgi:hypothetical protein